MTTVSELIEDLESLQEDYGDVAVIGASGYGDDVGVTVKEETEVRKTHIVVK